MRIQIYIVACAMFTWQVSSRAAGDSLVLGPNDRVAVQCVNAPEFPVTPLRIDGDGHITLPLIGRVKLAGLTVTEAERTITSDLSQFIRNPEVTLNVIESASQPVSILGAVNKPGSYQMEGEKTLAEAIGMAGGLRADAGSTLTISRRKSAGPLPLPAAAKDTTGEFYTAEISLDDVVLSRKPALNIGTKPFDLISIPKADIVYVVGEVRKPGGFPVTGHDGTSILQAIALAEGLGSTAAAKKAHILRHTNSESQEDIPVDVSAILAGKSKDVLLKANDVLFIPNNVAKSVGKRTVEAMVQAATGMVIYGRY